MAGPPLDPRGKRVFVALCEHGEYGGPHFAAGGVKLMVEPYDLFVVFTLALNSHDVYVTITEGPVADVANVLCDLDAYSATESRLGAGATFAPDNPRLRAAGYEGVLVVNLGFWEPFKEAESDLMIGDGDCLHLRGCFFITKKERAIRLAKDIDAMWDHFAETEKDVYAWPAPAGT